MWERGGGRHTISLSFSTHSMAHWFETGAKQEASSWMKETGGSFSLSASAFGDKIITRWRGEGWKQTVRAVRLKAQKVVGPLRRVRLFQSADHYVFVGRYQQAAFWRDLAWAELLSARKKVSFAEAQRASRENVKHQKQIFICEFVQAASSPKVCNTNLNCTLNNR